MWFKITEENKSDNENKLSSDGLCRYDVFWQDIRVKLTCLFFTYYFHREASLMLKNTNKINNSNNNKIIKHLKRGGTVTE